MRASGVALVARREIWERARSGGFRGTTALSVLLTVGLVVAPSLLARVFEQPARIGIVGTLPENVKAAVETVPKFLREDVIVESVPTRGEAERRLRTGNLDVALEGTDVIVDEAISPNELSARARLVNALSLAPVISTTPLPVTSLRPAVKLPDPSVRFTTLYGTSIIYFLLILYGQWILQGVAEEKQSRVVEVLLAALRPVELLTGKVIGIGALALAQAVLIAGSGFVAGIVVGSDWIRTAVSLNAVSLVGWFFLAYAFYCAAYAAAGALVTRAEEASGMVFPLMAPLIVAFMALSAAVSGDDTAFLTALSFAPPTAPLAMPMRIAIGTAEPWQVVVAIAGVLISTVIVTRVAARIYARSILRMGARVRVREALRVNA